MNEPIHGATEPDIWHHARKCESIWVHGITRGVTTKMNTIGTPATCLVV